MRLFLSAFILLAALTAATYAARLPRIQMHSGWVIFKDDEVRDGFKIFRRYGYTGDYDANPMPNLITFKCSKDVTKAASYLTFVLPKSFQPDSFPRSTWLPKIDVRILIDDDLSVLMPGEYRNGEFYFDLNTDTRDKFDKIMLADTLAISFGDKNDILQFQFTEKLDGFFSDFIQKFGSQFGEMTHYSRVGSGSVTDSCNAYQQSGPRSKSNYAKVAALPCTNLLKAYGNERFSSLSDPVNEYIRKKDNDSDFGSTANIDDYVVTECRLNENYKIGEAVKTLFDKKRDGSIYRRRPNPHESVGPP